MPTLKEVIFDPEHNPLSTKKLRESIADARRRAKRDKQSGFTSSGTVGATGIADLETPSGSTGPRTFTRPKAYEPTTRSIKDVEETAKKVRESVENFDPSGVALKLKAVASVVLVFAGIYVLGNLFNINVGGGS